MGGSSTNESFTWLFRQPLHERPVCDRHVVALHPDPDVPISEMQLTLSTSLPLSAPTNEKAFLFSDRQFQFRHSLLFKKDFNQKMHALDPPPPPPHWSHVLIPLGACAIRLFNIHASAYISITSVCYNVQTAEKDGIWETANRSRSTTASSLDACATRLSPPKAASATMRLCDDPI